MERSRLPSRLRVENGGVEERPCPGEVAILQGHPGRLDVPLRLPGERGLRAIQLGIDAVVARHQPLLRGGQRIDRRLHIGPLRLPLLLFRDAPRFRVGELLPHQLDLGIELLEGFRGLLRPRPLLLQRIDASAKRLQLAVHLVRPGIALGHPGIGGCGGDPQPPRRIGAQDDGAVSRIGAPADASISSLARGPSGRADLRQQDGEEDRGKDAEQPHRRNVEQIR